MDNNRPLTVDLRYEDGRVERLSYPQVVTGEGIIVGGEWVSLPEDLTDAESEWVFYELGAKMRHLGKGV